VSGVRYAGKGKRKGKEKRKKGRCPVRSAGKEREKPANPPLCYAESKCFKAVRYA